MKNKKKLIFVIVLFIFFLTGCNKDKSIINNNSDSMNYNETIASAKELDLLFKNNKILIKTINNYLSNEKDNDFSKLFNKYYNNISYDSLNDFQQHLIEAYSYFCVMSGYSGRSINEIYGNTEDNSFIGDLYVYGYDIPKTYNDYNIIASEDERIITIVAPSYSYSKKIYFYYEVKATKDDEGKNIYSYRDLNWDFDGVDNSLHYSNYKKLYADDYIVDFNYKTNNKKFSNLLYDYGYQILGGGKDGIQSYKDGIKTVINTN